MKLDTPSFRGMVPRLTPRALPNNAAQDATNARLQSGDLEAWRQFALTKIAAAVARTIYLLKDVWLTFTGDVDVARGIIPGDNTFRVYLTGPEVFTEPRWTNYALATTGAEPYPVTTRPIGVPSPDSAPTLVAGVDTTPTTFSINILDEGDSLDGNWTTSPLREGATYSRAWQDPAAPGDPAPAYRLDYDEIHNEGEQPFMYRNFGIGRAAVIHVEANFAFGNDTSFGQACMIVGAQALALSSAQVGWNSITGLYIAIASGWTPFVAALDAAGTGPLTPGVFYTLVADIVPKDDGTATVTASLRLGSGELATVTATGPFEIGDYVGFTNGIPDDSGSTFTTWYDNLLVQASGNTGIVPQNVATSYVYTFVNDIGEESAPSPVSATVLRPDGVSITVTSPTAVPSGISSDYGITTKRIYRAVTGAGGSIFRFVAEIPLGTADYVDTLPDTDLGEELESEGWELPPADLRGILALPNGVMAGFRRNQLCLSAQNRPHAWPVAFRQNTDTDIVGIAAIDTTVVIVTKSFPYIAIGSSPDAYSMSKMEVPQAGVSKRSIAYLIGFGVAFASPDGYMVIAGPGQVRNLTEGIFTRKQWQALNPQTIVGIAHDDVLHWWYDDEVIEGEFETPGGNYLVTSESILAEGWGGAGAGSFNHTGAGAGFSSDVISGLVIGELLTVIVGDGGKADGTGGFGGGGAGANGGGGGGGGSRIMRGSTLLWAAGGGAGAGKSDGFRFDSPGGPGGGSTGGSNSGGGVFGLTGLGGSQVAGGIGGVSGSGASGSNGALYTGGAGNTYSGSPGGGGGGGGGYYGGGGGGDEPNQVAGGGGGGSSYDTGTSTTSMNSSVGTNVTNQAPGNPADPRRGTAGEGGTYAEDGQPGRVFITAL